MEKIRPESLTPRSDVDFTLPQHREALLSRGKSDLSVYLMALAAYQRGLDITFYGSSVAARHMAWGVPIESSFPRLFVISDGKKSHLFNSTVGDLTSAYAAALAANKEQSKQLFKKAGIATPGGVLFNGRNHLAVDNFLTRSGSSSFIIKPVSGSLSRGVLVRLNKNDVRQYLKRFGEDRKLLVEENILGREYRVYVVDDRIAATYERRGVFVVGNGRDTVAQLIQNRNARVKEDPLSIYYPIDLARASDFLAICGQTLQQTPVLGQKIHLDLTKNRREGGVYADVTLALREDVAQTAIRAAKAADLPNSGIDIIENDDGIFVLEVNVRAGIGPHSLPFEGPGSGNAIAEAIVDHYFPSPEPICRDSTLALNFEQVNRAFQKDGTKTVFKLT